MSDVEIWSAVLDAFEARLEAQHHALALDAPDVVPPFVAPPLAGPLPDCLLDRAIGLVAQCRALEEQLAAAVEAVGASLAKLHTGPPAAQAQPMYFDSRV